MKTQTSNPQALEKHHASSPNAAERRRLMGAWSLKVLWSLVLGASCFSANAAFVTETSAEFLTSGDFNGDGLSDALVLDKLTGNVRVGYQNTNGILAWSPARSTGADAVSALAVGRFAQTNSEAIAITSVSPAISRIL